MRPHHDLMTMTMTYSAETWQDENVPERHKAVIVYAIDSLCLWLNNGDHDMVKYIASGDIEPYTPNTFLNTDINRYAATRVTFARETEVYLYLELSVYDGDDGGAQTLFVHAEPHRDGTYSLCSILHEFDTNYTSIYTRNT
jgi:hypothetical protein